MKSIVKQFLSYRYHHPRRLFSTNVVTDVQLQSLKERSKRLTGDIKDKSSIVKTTGARANLRAAGWDDEDMLKPVIAVGVPYSNALPCNNHLLELSDIVCKTIEKEGGVRNIIYFQKTPLNQMNFEISNIFLTYLLMLICF